MRHRRVRKGFRRAGDLRVDGLGMPPARGRALRLASAWRAVAGEAIARRAPALGIRRGVLEVEVPDETWARTLRELVPRLAGRLAASYPDLGIKKLRLRLGGETSRPPAVAVSAVEDEGVPDTRPARTGPDHASGRRGPVTEKGTEGGGTQPPVGDRLARIVDRYLARSQKP